MRIKIYLLIIIVFSMFCFMLDNAIGNIPLIKNIFVASFLTSCLYEYCDRFLDKAAKVALTDGLDDKAFISALDNAVIVNKKIKKASYLIIIGYGVMLLMCFFWN